MRTFTLPMMAAAAMLVTACSEVLNTSPLTSLDDQTIWKSETNAALALTACYKGSIPFNSYGYESDWVSYSGLLFMEMASDNAFDRRSTTTGNSSMHRISDGTLVPTNSSIAAYWTNSYKKVARCNDFIANIDRVPAAPSTIARMKSEARFLRAMQYFYLSQYFHDVPLVTQPLTKEDANSVTKTDRAAITRFIVDELTQIAPLLQPQSALSKADMGRATRQAALAFLGRTYLGAEEYAKAAEAFRQIMEMGENAIDPSYPSIFLPAGKGSSEIIFATQYLENLAGSGLPQHAYPAMSGGWHLICPLGSLYEAYGFADGSPFSYASPLYDPADPTKNRDPRMAYTLLWDQSTFKGRRYVSHPDSSRSPDQLGAGKQTTYTGFGLRKYFDEGFSGSLMSYGANVIVVRYAEVLLSYLEAVVEAGLPIDQPLLDATINRVRGRPSVALPPITELNRERLREIVRHERRVELALEGMRYWDLLRWGIAHTVLNGDFYGASFPGAKSMRKKGGRTDPYSRWYVISRSFRNPQDYRWPIPQVEQDINPNLRD